MPSLIKILIAATAVFAAFVSATPVAQKVDPAANLNGVVQPIETIIPKDKVYKGKDPGPIPVPEVVPSPAPSPRYTTPVKIVEAL